jgi:hypothetical protein
MREGLLEFREFVSPKWFTGRTLSGAVNLLGEGPQTVIIEAPKAAYWLHFLLGLGALQPSVELLSVSTCFSDLCENIE